MIALLHLPLWGQYLLQGVLVFIALAAAAVAATRAGRSAWHALWLVVPFVQIAALWAFAFARWTPPPLTRPVPNGAAPLPPPPDAEPAPPSAG